MTMMSRSSSVEPKPPMVRSPLFSYRLVVGLCLASAGVLLLLVFEQALLGFHEDLVSLQEALPAWVSATIEVATGTAIGITILVTNVGLLVRRRIGRWVRVNAAAFLAVILSSLTAHLVTALATSDVLLRAVGQSGDYATLGNRGLASLVAVLTLASPWISRRLRPWVLGVMAAGVSLSFVGGAIASITLPLDIGVGMVGGALVALVLKTRDLTPSAEEVARTLERMASAWPQSSGRPLTPGAPFHGSSPLPTGLSSSSRR